MDGMDGEGVRLEGWFLDRERSREGHVQKLLNSRLKEDIHIRRILDRLPTFRFNKRYEQIISKFKLAT